MTGTIGDFDEYKCGDCIHYQEMPLQDGDEIIIRICPYSTEPIEWWDTANALCNHMFERRTDK